MGSYACDASGIETRTLCKVEVISTLEWVAQFNKVHNIKIHYRKFVARFSSTTDGARLHKDP